MTSIFMENSVITNALLTIEEDDVTNQSLKDFLQHALSAHFKNYEQNYMQNNVFSETTALQQLKDCYMWFFAELRN